MTVKHAGWAAAIVVGGWVVTLVGYLATGMVAATLAPPSPAVQRPEVGTVEVVALLGMAAVVAAAVGLGAALARNSARMGRPGAAATAAAGPLAAVATALLLSIALDGSGPGTAAAHSAAAVATSGAVLWAVLRRRR
ncbi:hypothetical protein ACFO4E_09270 [Nocardiopsis mangrovi]|uniref:Uncharacterized protein n=1 Tax=Nocardiopsis mangrovi TaxID=1179818 RepID=A0ABV9DUK3_9ACTN